MENVQQLHVLYLLYHTNFQFAFFSASYGHIGAS